MAMPNRTYNSPDYRYGFNGKEKDESGEWGDLTHNDFGGRVYNPALGRWLARDPKTRKRPGFSPYNFVENSPIVAIDPDGNEKIIVVGTEEHYNTRGNNMMFAHHAISQLKKYKDIDEEKKIVLYKNGYTEKEIDALKTSAEKYGATVLVVDDADALVNYVNNKTADSPRNDDPVTSIDMFAHGYPNQIAFGEDGDKAGEYVFTEEDVNRIFPSSFAEGASCTVNACRVGSNSNVKDFTLLTSVFDSSTDSDEDFVDLSLLITGADQSLAQYMANKWGITVYAYLTRTDYQNHIGSVVDRLLYKLNQGILVEAMKERETITSENGKVSDWQPDGALHEVGDGSTPAGIANDKIKFTPNEKPTKAGGDDG